jgi:glycosyltransferase involved in cell wall biosynthesis
MISVIISTNRPDYALTAIENIKSQQHRNKELLLVLHGPGLDSVRLNTAVKKLEFPVRVIKRPASSIFGENLNIALDAASGEFITKMDDDDYYGEHHLEDLVAAYEYSRASAVGKRTNIVYLTNSDKVVTFSGQHEEKFSRHLPGATFLMRTEILKGLRFGRVKSAIDSELWRRLEVRGGTLYSTHDLNFIRVRHSDGHTYQTSDEDFIANSSTKPIDGLDKEYYFA